jgi:hypothetical protein
MFESIKKRTTCKIQLADGTKGVKLREYVKDNDEIVPVGFIFSDKGKYGRSVGLVVDENTLVWLPNRYTEIFDNFSDAEVNAIVSGKARLFNFETITTANGETVIFDME